MNKVIDKVNVFYGIIATFGVAVFGKNWFLFVGFLFLNVADFITGYIKAKFYIKNESSAIGAKGIFKKVSYWGIIGIAFFVSICFEKMGSLIGIDLAFVQMFGWFTLATYLVNEIRSILENLVEMNVKVPGFLVNGLEVTQKLLETKTNQDETEES